MKRKITVFVVVENSQGETELLAYRLKSTLEKIKNGMHFRKAHCKAYDDGYVVLASFDQDEPAGLALYNKAMIYGDKGRYLSDIVMSEVN